MVPTYGTGLTLQAGKLDFTGLILSEFIWSKEARKS